MKVELILAMDAGCGIGFEGRLPWPHCPKDMKRFQEITTGEDKIIVMGRHTHSDILAAQKERKRKNKDIKKNGVLKGRTSIVLSSTVDEFHGAVGMKTLRDVFNEYQFTDKTIVVIGGAKLFVEAMAWANTAHLTVDFIGHLLDDLAHNNIGAAQKRADAFAKQIPEPVKTCLTL